MKLLRGAHFPREQIELLLAFLSHGEVPQHIPSSAAAMIRYQGMRNVCKYPSIPMTPATISNHADTASISYHVQRFLRSDVLGCLATGSCRQEHEHEHEFLVGISGVLWTTVTRGSLSDLAERLETCDLRLET